ncbi:hypothetical protein R1sor_024689 [Riccia sorocarpa]|uniref:BAH domain-containing protein n=1 Tax=Riccia sorocarpa TaxID=122646 RepID=A0ABD3GRD5_9MARC
MSPPRVLFSQFPSLAPLGNAEIEEHKENAQDENEDDGPFASEALSDSEEENNLEQVPLTGRRFKETLREEKPPRVQVGNSRKRRPGEVDSDFVLSKLTPECLNREQRQFCCRKTCVWNLGINRLHSERKRYFRLSRIERTVYLESLVTKLEKGGVVFRLLHNLTVCRKAFKIIFCVGNSRLQRLRLPDKHPASIDTIARQPSAEAFILLEWLDSFFLSHCERQPADGKYHLPNDFTKKEVYDHYMTDMVQVRECLQYSSFKHYWVKFYPLVTIPTTNKFSVCDFCELYKSKRDKGVTSIEKAEAVEALKLHRKQQAEERAVAGRRRWKALDSPKDCAYIQIDGMDQKKTALPHFSKQPKSVDGAALVGVHLVGAMIFHGKLRDGQRRPIYCGPRRPPPGSAAADRAAHIGELTEIHDKSFLAVLADDETSFWICQVLKINRRNEEGEPTSVLIQWYATEDSNPYTGKFYPEKRRTNGKGIAALFRQEIDLEEVTVLSFNFNFTTARRLRKITERQIRTGLFRIAKDKEASQPEGINRLSPAIDSADDEETECSGPDLEDEEE